MNLHILPSDKLRYAKKIWKTLEKEEMHVSFNAQWDYIETWIRTYGKDIPHWFLYGEENGKNVGIVLFVKEVGRGSFFGIKGFSIGPDGESFSERVQVIWNTILVKDEYRSAFIEHVFATIKKEFIWEEISLDGFSSDEIQDVLKSITFLDLKYKVKKESEYVVDFKDQSDIYSVLSYNIRHKLRRCIKEFDDVEVVYATTLQEADKIYKDLITLHQQSWNKRGKPGVFASKKFTQFHRELIHRFLPQEKVGLVEVSSKKFGPIGCIYFYRDRENIRAYQSGFADFTQEQFPSININRIKPGYVTHALCMQECMNRGYKNYSFGPGHQIYKKELSNSVISKVSLKIQKGIKPKIREKMLDQYIKLDNTNSPIIKPIYAAYTRLQELL